MCLAFPRKVLEVGTGAVLVDVDGRPTWVRTTGVLALAPDEYVLVYAGHVVERLSTDEAHELLAMYASVEAAG